MQSAPDTLDASHKVARFATAEFPPGRISIILYKVCKEQWKEKEILMDMKNDPELEDMVQFLAKVLETALVIQMWNEIYEGMWELLLETLPPAVEVVKNIETVYVQQQPTVQRLYANLAPDVPMFMITYTRPNTSSRSLQTTT